MGKNRLQCIRVRENRGPNLRWVGCLLGACLQVQVPVHGKEPGWSWIGFWPMDFGKRRKYQRCLVYGPITPHKSIKVSRNKVEWFILDVVSMSYMVPQSLLVHPYVIQLQKTQIINIVTKKCSYSSLLNNSQHAWVWNSASISAHELPVNCSQQSRYSHSSERLEQCWFRLFSNESMDTESSCSGGTVETLPI